MKVHMSLSTAFRVFLLIRQLFTIRTIHIPPKLMIISSSNLNVSQVKVAYAKRVSVSFSRVGEAVGCLIQAFTLYGFVEIAELLRWLDTA
jgi:hypothetical protein